MRAGGLRRTVVIQAQSAGALDALNHPTPGGWTTVATTRGLISYDYKPSERRDARASTVVTTASAWITVRYRAGVTNGMRVIGDGQTWNIVDAQADSKHRVMRLFCEKVQGA